MGWRAQGLGGALINGDTLGPRVVTKGAAYGQDTARPGRPLGASDPGTGGGGGISIKFDKDSKRPQGTHSLDRHQRGRVTIGGRGLPR